MKCVACSNGLLPVWWGMGRTEVPARLLVVDDDNGIRKSFTDYLEDHGYRVLSAENGLEGLRLFEQARPDLVLLDLRMPKIDGIELLGRIRSISTDIPLIVVSGTGRIADAVESLRLGAWDFLLKPLEDLSVLGHTIEKSLERARLRQQNRKYQEDLERLVQQRTQELEQVNSSLNQLNDRLRKIVVTTSRLSAWLNIEEYGIHLLEEFAQHMGAQGGSLYLVEKEELRLLHTLDPGHAAQRIPSPLAENCLIRHVIQENKPSLIDSVEALQLLKGSGWHGYQDGSALAFPIPDEHGRVTAVLTLHNKQSPPFVEQDKEIGAILASYTCESMRAIRTFQALSESERRFRELADMLPQSICEADRGGRITYANQHAFDSFGYLPQDLETGLTLFDLIESAERGKASRITSRLLKEELTHSSGMEYLAVRKDGSKFPVLVYSAPILQGERPVGLRMVAVDITLRKQQEEVILHQAHFDNLTDLPNRFLALDRLSYHIKEAQRSAKKVAVFFLDLDDFKKINDSLGHAEGDQILILTAKRLLDVVRDVDVVGRLGGDEFIVVLGGLAEASVAKPVAEHLLSRFREPFCIDGRELLLTSSLGIAVYPDDGASPDELLRKADTAMYHAKAQGHNTYQFFTTSMNQGVSRRLLLEQHLHGALERGEFYLKYQPLIRVGDRGILGVESLLRWQSPVLGEVSPVEFIPIAEKNGLIIEIGEYVLNESLTKLADWQRRFGRSLKVAVNLSPRQFRAPELKRQIMNAIRTFEVAPQCVELEITEGVLMSGHTQVGDTLNALSQLGVGLSMDDFGTGYSSLNYLRLYPFDTLKIDRSFVRDITDDPRDRELVNAAIAMAHGLGLSAIAEGVETEAQLDYLARQGCDIAQGYLFSRPVSAEEIEGLLERSPRC